MEKRKEEKGGEQPEEVYGKEKRGEGKGEKGGGRREGVKEELTKLERIIEIRIDKKGKAEMYIYQS